MPIIFQVVGLSLITNIANHDVDNANNVKSFKFQKFYPTYPKFKKLAKLPQIKSNFRFTQDVQKFQVNRL